MFSESQNLGPKGVCDIIYLIAETYIAKMGKGKQQLVSTEDLCDLFHSHLKLTLTKKRALTWDEDGDCSLHRSTDDVVHRKHPVGPN